MSCFVYNVFVMKQNTNKRIVAINEVDFGSTGSIAISVLNKLKSEGYETLLVCHESKRRFDNEYIINKNKLVYLKNKILSRIDASDGFHSKGETKKLVKYLEKIKPDCLFLNNLHGSYINLPILFDFIKENRIKCIWTLHDCWTFTGKCAYFSYAKCNRWQNECKNCPMLNAHPRAYVFDKSKKLFNLKKKLFEGLEEFITFVSPSKWLDNFLNDSYLSNFRHVVINNGIDLTLFKRSKQSSFREKENIKEKKLILCCANVFDKTKGIDDIYKISKLIKEDEQIVLVGHLKEEITLPKNILHVDQTNNLNELIDIYSCCDVFFNPTHDDNYPTVNLEASACELPIVSYRTGGVPEVVNEKYLVDIGDVNSAYEIIEEILHKKVTYEHCNKNLLSKKRMLDSYSVLFREATK